MKLYIAGPVTGIQDDNAPAFAAAAHLLRAAGYEVVSPLEVCPEKGLPWSEYMRRDIVKLLKCDAVAMLPGYQESKGAMLETHIALELGMRFDMVGTWINEACECDADR
jgi:nucleoside 2-deoxyribosyltransferase